MALRRIMIDRALANIPDSVQYGGFDFVWKDHWEGRGSRVILEKYDSNFYRMFTNHLLFSMI